MIYWMLTRLELDPATVFYEKDLVARFPEELKQIKRDHLLQSLPYPLSNDNVSYYHLDLKRSYQVIPRDDGVLEAFDPEDPEAEPVELSPKDLVQLTLDRTRLALKFQEANDLKGKPQAMDDRLHFLGDKLIEGSKTAVVLGLFDNETTTMRYLRGLPNLLAEQYDRYMVVCPSFAPTPILLRELAAIRVVVVPLSRDDQWVINMPPERRPALAKGRKVILSDIEEKEFDQYGFQIRMPIHITAQREDRNATIVTIDGVPIPVPLADFRLFMFLVLALFQNVDGYLQWNEFFKHSDENLYEDKIAPQGLEQALSRLRSRFKSPLSGLKGNDLIERKLGRVRNSTHTKYITYDREGLLHHRDLLVRKFAQKLPSDPEHIR